MIQITKKRGTAQALKKNLGSQGLKEISLLLMHKNTFVK